VRTERRKYCLKTGPINLSQTSSPLSSLNAIYVPEHQRRAGYHHAASRPASTPHNPLLRQH